jgi:aralkylamine N-acetyltransferase
MSPIAPFTISTDIDNVDWQALVAVFDRAPLGKRDPVVLEQSFRNSGCVCFAYHSTELIGAGRTLTDRTNYALVLDVVVVPEHQGKGYGREIMRFLASASGAKNVILHSVPEKQAFYSRLGYRKMKTAMALFENPAQWCERGYIE